MDWTTHGCVHDVEMPLVKNDPGDQRTKSGMKFGKSESTERVLTPAELYGCLCHQPMATAEKWVVLDDRFDDDMNERENRQDRLDKLFAVAK